MTLTHDLVINVWCRVAKVGVWGGSWTHLPPLMMRSSKHCPELARKP